jgi:hypothetical protein
MSQIDKIKAYSYNSDIDAEVALSEILDLSGIPDNQSLLQLESLLNGTLETNIGSFSLALYLKLSCLPWISDFDSENAGLINQAEIEPNIYFAILNKQLIRTFHLISDLKYQAVDVGKIDRGAVQEQMVDTVSLILKTINKLSDSEEEIETKVVLFGILTKSISILELRLRFWDQPNTSLKGKDNFCTTYSGIMSEYLNLAFQLEDSLYRRGETLLVVKDNPELLMTDCLPRNKEMGYWVFPVFAERMINGGLDISTQNWLIDGIKFRVNGILNEGLYYEDDLNTLYKFVLRQAITRVVPSSRHGPVLQNILDRGITLRSDEYLDLLQSYPGLGNAIRNRLKHCGFQINPEMEPSWMCLPKLTN